MRIANMGIFIDYQIKLSDIPKQEISINSGEICSNNLWHRLLRKKLQEAHLNTLFSGLRKNGFRSTGIDWCLLNLIPNFWTSVGNFVLASFTPDCGNMQMIFLSCIMIEVALNDRLCQFCDCSAVEDAWIPFCHKLSLLWKFTKWAQTVIWQLNLSLELWSWWYFPNSDVCIPRTLRPPPAILSSTPQLARAPLWPQWALPWMAAAD